MNYRALALADLKALGLTAIGLIERYPQEIKRFRLACDLGDTGNQLPASASGEDQLLSAANAWLDLVTSWSPQENIADIELPILETAFQKKSV